MRCGLALTAQQMPRLCKHAHLVALPERKLLTVDGAQEPLPMSLLLSMDLPGTGEAIMATAVLAGPPDGSRKACVLHTLQQPNAAAARACPRIVCACRRRL
jgi:hypothetical protein